VDEFAIFERCYQEQGIIHKPGEVACRDRIAHVSTPYGQALALALLQVATTHRCPAGVAGKNTPAGFHLVIYINHTSQSSNPMIKIPLSFQRTV